MNAFLVTGLEEFRRRPFWDPKRRTRGGEALMALQNREAMFGRSVVSNCFADGGVIATGEAAARRASALERVASAGDVHAFAGVSSDARDQEVAAWLLASGVRRLVVGHKPSGDCPAVLSAKYTGVEVVSADTSFSDPSGDKAGDTRGAALCSVVISGPSVLRNHLEISGVLRDGAEYTARLQTLASPSHVEDGEAAGSVAQNKDGADGDPLLGTETEDGWWYKALLTPPDEPTCGLSGAAGTRRYRQTKGAGRRWETRDVQVPASENSAKPGLAVAEETGSGLMPPLKRRRTAGEAAV